MKTLALIFVVGLVCLQHYTLAGYNGCTGTDCIVYDLSTAGPCSESTSAALGAPKFSVGLRRDLDITYLKCRVIAYKIQWFSGAWSGWYVPGYNDVDYKFNTGVNTLRRMWSYFDDHTFKYICCN